MLYLFNNSAHQVPSSLLKCFQSLNLIEIDQSEDICSIDKGILIFYHSQNLAPNLPIHSENLKVMLLIDTPERLLYRDYLLSGFDYPIHIYDCHERFMSLLNYIISENNDPFPELTLGPIKLNPNNKKVFLDGKVVELRNKEYELFSYLLIRANQVVSKTEIQEEVWKYRYDVFTKTIDTHFHHLKRKFNNSKYGKILHTVYGEGYRLSLT